MSRASPFFHAWRSGRSGIAVLNEPPTPPGDLRRSAILILYHDPVNDTTVSNLKERASVVGCTALTDDPCGSLAVKCEVVEVADARGLPLARGSRFPIALLQPRED